MMTYVKVAIVIVFEILIFLAVVRTPRVSLSCDTYSFMESVQGDTVIKGNYSLRLFIDGSGMLGVDGYIKLKGKDYPLRKEIKITYKALDDGTFQFTRFKLDPSDADDRIDNAISEYFFPIKRDGLKLFTLYRVHDTWVVGGRFTPAFMCRNNV